MGRFSDGVHGIEYDGDKDSPVTCIKIDVVTAPNKMLEVHLRPASLANNFVQILVGRSLIEQSDIDQVHLKDGNDTVAVILTTENLKKGPDLAPVLRVLTQKAFSMPKADLETFKRKLSALEGPGASPSP